MMNINSYAASYCLHTVSPNETYEKIASIFGVDGTALQKINSDNYGNLKAGDLIKIREINDIKIKVNDGLIKLEEKPYMENNRVYIPLRFIAEVLNADSVVWDGAAKSIVIKKDENAISIAVGSKEASINGQVVSLDAPVQIFSEKTYVPVRFFAEAFEADSISWDASTSTVNINKNGLIVKDEYLVQSYSEEDLYWLSRLVNVEAAYDTYEGKVAVANTIINRKRSSQFPDTIKGVIFDKKYGIQFPPAYNGLIDREPNEDSINAAIDALEGHNNVGDSIYFASSSSSPNSWVKKNRTYYTTVGKHDFYL